MCTNIIANRHPTTESIAFLPYYRRLLLYSLHRRIRAILFCFFRSLPWYVYFLPSFRCIHIFRNNRGSIKFIKVALNEIQLIWFYAAVQIADGKEKKMATTEVFIQCAYRLTYIRKFENMDMRCERVSTQIQRCRVCFIRKHDLITRNHLLTLCAENHTIRDPLILQLPHLSFPYGCHSFSLQSTKE